MNKPTDITERLANPKTTMTEEQYNDLSKKIYNSCCQVRSNIITRHPFIGGILMRLDFVPIRDYRCDTACTDGNKIYIDMDFYKTMTNTERMFVLAHEVWHVVYMHFLRRQNREAEPWNIATDCEINYMLREDGFKPPANLYFPEKDDEGRSAEYIYEKIIKRRKDQSRGGGSCGRSGRSGGYGATGDSSSGKYSNSNNKKLNGQFDKHVSKKSDTNNGAANGSDGDGDDNSNGSSLPKDQWGEKGIDKNFNPEISKDSAEKIREMIVNEIQRIGRQKGSLPNGLEQLIDNILKPEISWKEYLCQFVTSSFGDRRQWLPPSRRHVWHDGYFQSRRSEKINVVVTVDTSGSTTADLPKFMTELVSLLNTFGRYELTLVQCDAAVQDITVYDDMNEFPVNGCSKIKWKGFGGSDLRPAFKELARRGTEASCHIVFTDGYIDFPARNELGVPTMIVLTKDGHEECCPWASVVVRFKEDTGSYS